jgi:tetratricopeptide (TPR) repeat protein
LNIALVYYRQNRFDQAIPPLESALHDEPANTQAAYLLALCNVFTDRYAAAVPLIEKLWDTHSSDLAFLYVAAVAADGAHRADLEKKAIDRMIAVGQDSAEMHLYMGKAYLSRQQHDKAINELQTAARLNPKLPFVHYYLGAALRHSGELERARAEFLADLAVEPDVALDYDQLGAIASALSQPAEAERYFRQALRLNPDLASSQFGLAKVLRERGDTAGALQHLEAAGRLDPASASVHYLRAQVLRAAGRQTEASQEFAAAARIQKTTRDKLQQVISGTSTPDPQPPF